MSKDYSEYAKLLQTIKNEKLQQRTLQGQLRKQALQPIYEFAMTLQHHFNQYGIVHNARFPGSDFDHPVCSITPQEVSKPILVTCEQAEQVETPDGKHTCYWTIAVTFREGDVQTFSHNAQDPDPDYDRVYTYLVTLIAELQAEHARIDRYLIERSHQPAELSEETL